MLKYAEGFLDQQAAHAVRERIDWKYALGLELTDPGFDFSVLSEFRRHLVESHEETLLADRLLEVCKQVDGFAECKFVLVQFETYIDILRATSRKHKHNRSVPEALDSENRR